MRHTRGQATIVFYTDETTPGNNKRPDKGRSYEALLWTIKQLPDFFVQGSTVGSSMGIS